jgi:hypothetical protein
MNLCDFGVAHINNQCETYLIAPVLGFWGLNDNYYRLPIPAEVLQ